MRESEILYLILYVDDLLLFSSLLNLINNVAECLKNRFKVKELDPISTHLGIEVNYYR